MRPVTHPNGITRSVNSVAWVVLAMVLIVLGGCRQEPSSSPRGMVLPVGDVARGQQAFVDLKCFSCHEVAGLEKELPRPTAEPQVDVVLGGLSVREPTDGELLTAILNPPHALYPGGEKERITVEGTSRMANYNDIITAQQLIDLVAFLHQRYETTQPATD